MDSPFSYKASFFCLSHGTSIIKSYYVFDPEWKYIAYSVEIRKAVALVL